MNKNLIYVLSLFLVTSCSYLTGPEGYFPTTEHDFLEEIVETDIVIPSELSSPSKENHYPVIAIDNELKNQEVPKPRQIFSSSGNSSVQLRRLGELMWIYIETLPSTSWPISKSYWETSDYDVISTNPDIGEIKINFDESMLFVMKIEHGIKEASTEIFLNLVNKGDQEIISNIDLVQAELENLVNYFAESVDNFSGTSLAAQNLNEMKKANYYTEDGQTVIELNLNFDRAWSSVTKAMQVAEIVTNDKNRNDGIFYVSYSKEEERGLLSFFGLGRSSNNNNAFNEEAQFEVTIVEKNNKTYVRARSMNGKIDEAEQLLSKINESLS